MGLWLLLPVLVPLDMLVNLYLVARHSRHVNRPHLFRSILPPMGVGVLMGIIAFQYIEGDLLKTLFGLLVILLSTRELYRLLRKRHDPIALSKLAAKTCIVSAGIVHGIYASGGPLLIYAVSRLNLSKSEFRSTLAAVWLIFTELHCPGGTSGDFMINIIKLKPCINFIHNCTVMTVIGFTAIARDFVNQNMSL